MAVQVLPVDLGPGVVAGFTLRSGGVSSGGFAESNLGSSVGDDEAAVAANIADVSAWLGARPVFAHQVHGADVRVVDLAAGVVAGQPSRVDVQVAVRPPAGQVPRFGLGVLAADCLPVLFADPVAGVLATAHAGRRGLAAGALQAAVAAVTAAGGRREDLRAVVGPGICGRCYEIPDALRRAVDAAVPGTGCVTDAGTPGLDLPAGAASVLAALGLHSVEVVDRCTATDDAFFSYRGAGGPGGVSGRFAGVVAFAPTDRADPADPADRADPADPADRADPVGVRARR